MTIRLEKPSIALLSAYVDALHRGFAPTNVRPAAAIAEHLADIGSDPETFVANLDDPEAKGPPVTLPDGSQIARIPGYYRWIIDDTDEFCGFVLYRWQTGTTRLPPYVLGHIGYIVAPWKQGHGYAAKAVRLLLPEARKQRLPFADLVINENNTASRKTATAVGGRLVGTYRKPESYGGGEALLYRINL